MRRVLPPRPRLRDFVFGGAACGLLLAAAETTLLWLADEALPPQLAALAIGAEALSGAALATLLGVALRALGRRPAHSVLAGALMAPLLALPALAAFAAGLAPAAGLAALLLALVAGTLAARTGGRLEQAGIALSAPLLLAPAAALVALAEGGRRGLGALPAGALAPWILGAAAALALSHGLSLLGPRQRAAPAGWGATVASSTLFAAVAASLPLLVPFVLLDPASGPPSPDAPASAVLLDLGTAPSGPPRDAGLDATRLVALASAGVRYDAVIPRRPEDGVAAALLTADGEPVLAALAARGYATAAVARVPSRVADLGAGEVDARPGAAGRLSAVAGRMVGAALLRALPPSFAAALGIDAPLRSDQELAQDAARWLAHWRATRSRVPFFLVVDFSDGAAPPPDAALGSLVDPLRELDAGSSALLLAGARDERLAPMGGFRLLAIPPIAASAAPRGVRVLGGIEANAFTEVLRALPDGQAQAPFALPAAGLGTDDETLP